MSTVTGFIKSTTHFEQAAPSGLGGAATVDVSTDLRLANGSSAKQVQKVSKSTASLAGGANADVDLSALTDPFGTAINPSEIRYLRIEWPSTANGTLEVKGSASNGWEGATALTKDVSDILVLAPGCSLTLEATQTSGVYLVDGTHKSINLKNNGAGAASYTLIVVGV